METVFDRSTFKFLLIYLDDIIVYSKTFKTHLLEVFQRLKQASVNLKSAIFSPSL